MASKDQRLEIRGCLAKSRLISAGARESWTPGALGAALSHLHCWHQCVEYGKAMLIVEDDVVLASDWPEQLGQLSERLDNFWHIVLLSWNYNSLLLWRDAIGIEHISLLETAYLEAERIKTILNCKRNSELLGLQHPFGLPGYLLSPAGAEELINRVLPMEVRPLNMGRGIPIVDSGGIDGRLNQQ